METRANYVAVGALVMVTMLAAFIVVLWLTGAQYRQEFAYYRSFFNGPVTGLGVGTIARYNGIDAGRVSKLAFDPDDPKRVIVTLQIDPTLKLHTDSVASIESQGLTGGSYVEITGGTVTAPFLAAKPGEDYPTIPSKPSTLQELAQSAPQMVSTFNTVGTRMGDLLNDDNRKAMGEIMANLRDTTALINKHSADIDATLANMRQATAGINTTLATANKALGSTDTALKSVTVTLGSADETVKKLGTLSDDADKVINGQGVAQMTQLVAQTRQLITSLTRLANDLERDPTRIIYGDQRQGYSPK